MVQLKWGRVRRLTLAACSAAVVSLGLAGGAMADQPSGVGSFVISDQNAAVGSQVTFWGAQWWKQNPLSTGLAPASFKGFADTATATCGETWTRTPAIARIRRRMPAGRCQSSCRARSPRTGL